MKTVNDAQYTLFDTVFVFPERTLSPRPVKSEGSDLLKAQEQASGKRMSLTPDSTRRDLYAFCLEHQIKNAEAFIRGWFNADRVMRSKPGGKNDDLPNTQK